MASQVELMHNLEEYFRQWCRDYREAIQKESNGQFDTFDYLDIEEILWRIYKEGEKKR